MNGAARDRWARRTTLESRTRSVDPRAVRRFGIDSLAVLIRIDRSAGAG
jgi:hypothetical protein